MSRCKKVLLYLTLTGLVAFALLYVFPIPVWHRVPVPSVQVPDIEIPAEFPIDAADFNALLASVTHLEVKDAEVRLRQGVYDVDFGHQKARVVVDESVRLIAHRLSIQSHVKDTVGLNLRSADIRVDGPMSVILNGATISLQDATLEFDPSKQKMLAGGRLFVSRLVATLVSSFVFGPAKTQHGDKLDDIVDSLALSSVDASIESAEPIEVAGQMGGVTFVL